MNNSEYYKYARPELIQHVLPGSNRVLEVGCAEGFLGQSLKRQRLAGEVIGIELVPEVAKVAEERLDHVICGDIDSMDRTNPILLREPFDYIICGDVLEHLREPWAALRWLVTLLKKDGRLIASIPNVRHWTVILPLIFNGSWKYRDSGIMDRTHLRFFTKSTCEELFEDAGMTVDKWGSTGGKYDKVAMRMSLGLLNEFFSVQWVLVGKPRV